MRVGVFVNAPEDFVLRAIGECNLTMLQFHGDEPPEFCTQFGLMSMKAFRIRDAKNRWKKFPDYQTDAYLLDAFSSTTLGGTGEKFNWDLAVEAQKFGKPIFLAGGLTPENVADAVYYFYNTIKKSGRSAWTFRAAWKALSFIATGLALVVAQFFIAPIAFYPTGHSLFFHRALERDWRTDFAWFFIAATTTIRQSSGVD
jgi:hypothetical protein